MDLNYSSTKLPTTGSSSAIGGASAWSNPSRITTDDGSSATWGAFMGGQMSLITGSSFGFQQLPNSAVIDGIEVYIDGSQTGCWGGVSLSIAGTSGKDLGALSGSYGDNTDLWGLTTIDPADIATISVSIDANDVSGGDGIASIDYISVTVFWHIEVANTAAEVPTRFEYKVYSKDGNYLGLLPDVTSKFGFAQDINSAGSSIVVSCGKYGNNPVTVSPLLDESGNIITTEDDLPILTTSTELLIAEGSSPDDAIFKNSNRLKVWMFNKYYPNGKLVFSGQVNKIEFKYGGGDASAVLTVYSDGLDLNNFIARGYPFAYTTDQSQTSTDGYSTIEFYIPAGWYTQGQSFVTGVGVTNIGAISLMLQGTADVTLSLYDGPNGNFLASATKTVSYGSATVVQFEFSQLVDVDPSSEYFFAIWLPVGQSIRVYANTGGYSNGSRYFSTYSGGSGGGSFTPDLPGDMYFVTKSGTPTTTTTYTSDDPVSDMAHGILLDYNARGGLITERDFDATGLSLTYTFVVSFIYDALKKILELCPTGYYTYIDLGTAEIDIKATSTTPDFTVVRGRHINELTLVLSTEQVKNYLLLSGGETAGVNLYRQYQDSESVANYGLRTSAKADNRITLDATADAIGTTFIEENAGEIQQTSLTVLNDHIDITLLTPGKTIGFKNFGNFIDDMVLQIVRREPNFSDGAVVLTLGRLPIRMNDEIQRINRDLLNEQTINNPSQPT
jgi:hypothetical protein